MNIVYAFLLNIYPNWSKSEITERSVTQRDFDLRTRGEIKRLRALLRTPNASICISC